MLLCESKIAICHYQVKSTTCIIEQVFGPTINDADISYIMYNHVKPLLQKSLYQENLKKIHQVPQWPREDNTNQSSISQPDERVITLEEKKLEMPNNVVNLKEE